MRYKAIVLHSGGLDSSTLLGLAVKEHGAKHVLAVSIFYGQRHQIELDAAEAVCKHYGVTREEHHLNLDIFRGENSGLLIDHHSEVPHKRYSELEGVSPSYVPFRNGNLLATATALAVTRGASELWYGAHAEDAGILVEPEITNNPQLAAKLAYAAGIFDGEGSVTFNQSPTHNALHFQLMIGQATTNVLDWLDKEFRNECGGNIYKKEESGFGKEQVARWVVTGNGAARFLQRIFPYLQIRRGDAEWCIALWRNRHSPNILQLLEEYKVWKAARKNNENPVVPPHVTIDPLKYPYPDCTPEFNQCMASAIDIGTYGKVKLLVPLQWATKSDIIKEGVAISVPYRLTRSCYTADELPCGNCPTCLSRLDGFAALGLQDPADYQATAPHHFAISSERRI